MGANNSMFLAKRRYLLLIPVVFLIFNAVYFMYATKEIEDTLLQEKYEDIIHAVDMLGMAVDANTGREWLGHDQNIRESVEYLDTLYQVYSAAYQPDSNGNLDLFTQRTVYSTPFDPMIYADFRKAISEQESGKLSVWFGIGTPYERQLHLYFRWMPLYSSTNERFLVVAGVSKYSVSSAVPMWVSVGEWASTVVTFALNVWLIVLVSRVGVKRAEEARANV